MKKVLLGVIGCLAAAAAQAQDWGGAYAGLSLGRFQAKSTWTTTQLGDGASLICPPGCPSTQDAEIGAIGAQYAAHAGYNWSLGRSGFVGLEAGLGNTNARKTLTRTPGFSEDSQVDRVEAKYEWNASLVGRAGVGIGRLALYGLAGPSWQQMSIRFTCPSVADSWCTSGSNRETRAEARMGWVAGVGGEWQLPQRWVARLDFRYAKYRDRDYEFFGNSGTDQVFVRTTLKTSVLALGVSYRF